MNILFSLVAVALTFIGFYPYVKGILQNTVKPHVFSWIIWALTTLIIFFAQLQSDAGVGAIAIGISGMVTLLISILAYIQRADISIASIDWFFFIIALSSIPLWYLTSDPLWSVIILTVVDLLGFAPTLRKVFVNPYSESILFFLIFTLRNFCVIIALESYSVTTVLFPLAVMMACIYVIAIMLWRRQRVPSSHAR